MKHIDKKLLGIAGVGLSAWALVIALVIFDNTTTAMLTNEPTPSAEQTQATNDEAQPRTLGATSENTPLPATSESSAPDQGEIQGASITQAPASNSTQAGERDLSSELETSANAKPSKLWIPIALISGVFLLVGAGLWFFASRQKSTHNQ